MKMCMYIIGLALMVIMAGCTPMSGELDPAADSEWPWETVTPESQGINSDDLMRMVKVIEEKNLAIHSIIIYKDGTIPFEMYFDTYNKNCHNRTAKGALPCSPLRRALARNKSMKTQCLNE